MSEFKQKKIIDDLEEKLNSRYETLLAKLRGTVPTNKDVESFALDWTPHFKINSLELRLAADDFTNILKEIKKFAK